MLETCARRRREQERAVRMQMHMPSRWVPGGDVRVTPRLIFFLAYIYFCQLPTSRVGANGRASVRMSVREAASAARTAHACTESVPPSPQA